MSALRSAANNAKGEALKSRPEAGVLRPLSILMGAVLIVLLFSTVACKPKGEEAQREASELGEAKKSYDTGKFGEAEKSLRAVLDDSPDNLDAMRSLALALAAQGKNDEAIEVYRTVIEGDAKDHASLYRLALLERLIGNPKQAAIHLSDALDLKPRDPNYTDELARTLMALGEYQRAATTWGSLLSKGEMSDESRKGMLVLQAQAYQSAKDYSRARKAYSAALKIDPNDEALRDRVEAFQ